MPDPLSNSTTIHHHHAPLIVAAVASGLILTSINLVTIGIVISSVRLRTAANIPVVSFLVASALQSLVVVPAYLAKQAERGSARRPSWLCDAFRFPYFVCAHTMVMSLLYISFDRLLALKIPYQYSDFVTKQRVSILLVFTWIAVLAVDIIPFLPLGKQRDTDGCLCIPQKAWGFCVIFFFSILPFVLIFTNYSLLWRAAARFEMSDQKRKRALTSSYSECVRNNSSTRLFFCAPWYWVRSLFRADGNRRQSARQCRDLENSVSTLQANAPITRNGGMCNGRASSRTATEIYAQDLSDVTKKNLLMLKASTAEYLAASSSVSDSMDTDDCSTATTENSSPVAHPQVVAKPGRYACANSLCNEDSDIAFHEQNMTKIRTLAKSKASRINLMFAVNMRCTKTSLILLTVYLFCWGPLAVFYAIDHYCNQCLSSSDGKHQRNARLLVKVLCLSSSFLAPIAYCWRTRDFRQEVWRRFCRRFFIRQTTDLASNTSSAKYSLHPGRKQ